MVSFINIAEEERQLHLISKWLMMSKNRKIGVNITQLVSSDIVLWVFFCGCTENSNFYIFFFWNTMLFIAKDELENYCQYNGLLHDGGFYLLSIQLLMALSLTVWAMVVTYILLWVSFFCIIKD